METAVGAGRLAPGERLPSVRALATALGVSPTTVAGAFADLRRRGVVVSRPRSGVEVARRGPAVTTAARPVPAGVRDLSTGNPDPALLPDVVRALRTLDAAPRLYGTEAVDPALRAAVGAKGDLAVTGGGLDGIERVLAAQLAPGDAVAVEDPGFSSVVDVIRALGLTPLPVPIDAEGMRADAIPAQARAVILTPRGHNPTGAILSPARARALRRVLEPDVLVVEDDHLGPVAGAPLRSIVEGRDRWAVVSSVSKWLGPDLRCAVVAGDATTIRRVQARQALGPGWVSTLIQRAVAHLWTDPETAALSEQATTVYAGRRRALVTALAAHGIAALGDSGLNVWIPVEEEEHAAAGLLAAGWAVAAGARFRHASPPGLRVTTATLRPAEATALAADLAGLLTPSTRTRAA